MELDPESVDDRTAASVLEIGIPPCPQVLADFMQEISGEQPEMRRLGGLIGSDVGLAAAVIRTVNSPLFGASAHATTVHGALAALGLRRCANLIAGLLLRRAFSAVGDPAIAMFWDHSARHAEQITFVARWLGRFDVSDAHTFGLFRDCGVPLLLARFFDYGSLYAGEHAQGVSALGTLERARYGIDHAALGAQLAQRWYLPEAICQAIRWHHLEAPAPAPLQSARRLAAASILTESLDRARPGLLPGDYWSTQLAHAATELGMDAAPVAALRIGLHAAWPG